MALNIIVIVITLSIALLWSATNLKGRGAFSALLNMLCVLAAGAVSLGLWQFLTRDIILGMASGGGTLENVAWGLGLLGPFIVALALLRLTLDLTIRANIKLNTAADFTGGLLFGAVSGLITAGFIVLGIGMLRTGPTAFGHQPLADDGGKIVYESGLWLPVDRLTVSLYEHLSRGALSTGTPLATEIPDLHEHAASLRFVPTKTDGSLGRVTITPESFDAFTAYTLEGPLNELLSDTLAPEKAQDAVMPDGSRYPQGSTLLGIAIRFDSGAAEAGGQVVLAPAQLRLVIQNDQTGETDAVYPIAIISRTDRDDEFDQIATDAAGAFAYRRFRVDSNNLAFPTVGGDSTHFFIPEFLVPPGFSPKNLWVKGIPDPGNLTDVDPTPVLQLLSQAADSDLARDFEDAPAYAPRDLGLFNGLLLQALNIPVLSGTDWLNLEAAGQPLEPREAGITRNNRFPARWVLTNNTKGGLASNQSNEISSGTQQFDRELLSQSATSDLRIDSFAERPTTSLVRLEVRNQNGEFTDLGSRIERSLNASEVPVLVNESGEQFLPAAYIYADGATVTFSLDPTSPLRRLDELPDQLSSSKTDQSLWLYYRVTTGSPIIAVMNGLREGDENKDALATLQPPLTTNRR